MAIFGYIELENVVQVNDKTRISCAKTFTSIDESRITLVEIEPEAGAGFIEVANYALDQKPKPQEWILDWQYATGGLKTTTLRITTEGNAPVNFTASITVVSEADDMLWSRDQDLMAKEPDILKWVPQGRNSYKNVHRAAQSLILEWLDAIRVWRQNGQRLEKSDLKVTTDLKELSTYWTLHLIFKGLQNKPDDVFAVKAQDYLNLVKQTQGRGRIQADFNQDTVVDETESQDLKSFRMVRR